MWPASTPKRHVLRAVLERIRRMKRYTTSPFQGKLKQYLVLFLWLNTYFSTFGQVTDLTQRLDSIFRTPSDSLQTEALFNCFTEASQFVQSKKKSQELLPYALKMLAVAKASGSPHRIAKAHQALSYLYSTMKDYTNSFTYSTLAYTQWEKEKYWQGIAELKFHNAYLQMNNGDEKEIIPQCPAGNRSLSCSETGAGSIPKHPDCLLMGSHCPREQGDTPVPQKENSVSGRSFFQWGNTKGTVGQKPLSSLSINKELD